MTHESKPVPVFGLQNKFIQTAFWQFSVLFFWLLHFNGLANKKLIGSC